MKLVHVTIQTASFEDEIKHNDFIAVFPASQYEEVVQALTGNN